MKVYIRLLFALSVMCLSQQSFSAQVIGVGSGKCMDAYGWGTANGTRIAQYYCHGGNNQYWKLTSSGEIRGHGNKCLDVSGAGTTDGTPVQLWDCHGGSNQKWTRDISGRLVDLHSGKCLDVPGYSTADGAFLQIWTCHTGTNQKWNIY